MTRTSFLVVGNRILAAGIVNDILSFARENFLRRFFRSRAHLERLECPRAPAPRRATRAADGFLTARCAREPARRVRRARVVRAGAHRRFSR